MGDKRAGVWPVLATIGGQDHLGVVHSAHQIHEKHGPGVRGLLLPAISEAGEARSEPLVKDRPSGDRRAPAHLPLGAV